MSGITTPGALLIKHMLPTEEAKKRFDLHKPLDKSGMSDLVNILMTHGGPESGESINDLAKLFFHTATEQGFSTPLSDYENDSTERAALLGEFEAKVSDIMSKGLTKREETIALNDLSAKYLGLVNKQNLDYLVARGSTAGRMAKTGARGNPNQLGQGTASPLMAADVNGRPIPIAIKHSFAEGLSSAEHLAMSYGGRASTVLSQLSTSLPGSLFKKLTPNLMHEVVTVPDCKTTNGIYAEVMDKKHVLGRVEAGTNRTIDEFYLKELQANGPRKIKIRSPMTCEAHEGICAKCYGLSATGKFPEIGFNSGVIASQSASEVLTQAMLSTKHQGGTAGRKRNAYELAHNILYNPKQNFMDEATIATLNGKVTKIEQTPLKDYEVHINGKPHFVSKEQDVQVKLGDELRAGDRLSTGVINPRKLVELKGFGAGRRYMMEELRNIYGPSLDPRHFELISKNIMKYVQIEHPGDTGFLPGDKVDIADIYKHLRASEETLPTSLAEGRILSRAVLEMTPGTLLDQNHIHELLKFGVKDVVVTKTGLKVTPLVPGLKSTKLLDKNWVSNLSFEGIQKTLMDAAATGKSSPLHSTDPVTSYMMGSEFGEGTNGRY